MARYERTPTAVTVTFLDLSEVEADALRYLRAHAQTDIDLGKDEVSLPSKVRTGWKWGAVFTPHGVYALCTEGVGPNHPITDEQKLEVDLYVEAYEGMHRDFISMFPACSIKIGPDDIRRFATG